MVLKNSFIKGAAILMVANAVSKILGAVLKIPLTYILHEEGMAVYNTAFGVYAMFLAFIMSGVPFAVSKMSAAELAKNNPNGAKSIVWYSSVILFLAGLFGSLVGGLLVYFLQGIWGLAIPYWHLLLVSTGCGVLGQLGDLYASKIKRWAGVKDYGTLFPGHGGVMDRADSALMCAPLVLIYFYLMFVA